MPEDQFLEYLGECDEFDIEEIAEPGEAVKKTNTPCPIDTRYGGDDEWCAVRGYN